MVRLALFVIVLYAACAAGSTAQVPPGQPGSATEPPPIAQMGEGADAAAPDAPAAADRAGIEADFGNAKARFDAGDGDGARVALENFVARHPGDSLRPAADLLLARLALIRNQPAAAETLLDPLAADPSIGGSARYYLGLASLRLGKAARAKELLLPFLPKAAGGADASNVELYGALAEAFAGSGDPVGAIVLWDSYLRAAREHERVFARVRAEQLAAPLSGEACARAFAGTPPDGLARAVLGPRAAAYLRGQGDAAGAALIDGETARARRALGLDEGGPRGAAGNPSRVGLALPLSGKFQPVGEAALRAAMLAVGALDAVSGGGWAGAGASGDSAPGSQLMVRDTATDPERAARGIVELAREEAVIGAVGAAERKTGAGAIAEATQDGLPLLALDDQPPGAGSTGFQLIHAPEARVAELARRALKLGARDFAILGPDSASGKRLREAFRKEITAGGGRITAESTYVAGVTSFSGAVAALKKGAPPQAVFVPDSSDRLELIAPALAFADLWPQPWAQRQGARPRGAAAPGAAGKPRPRPILLLSTANDLSPKLLQNAGRYVQGALLSPGFFADDEDPRSRAFVEAYRAAYGQDPHATEAYAFDGVRLLRRLTESGAHTRADLLRALAGGPFEGLTGDVRFGADHARIDPPLVYVVDGDDIKALR